MLENAQRGLLDPWPERYHRGVRRAERTEVTGAGGLRPGRLAADPAPTIGFSFGGSATIRMEANGSEA